MSNQGNLYPKFSDAPLLSLLDRGSGSLRSAILYNVLAGAGNDEAQSLVALQNGYMKDGEAQTANAMNMWLTEASTGRYTGHYTMQAAWAKRSFVPRGLMDPLCSNKRGKAITEYVSTDINVIGRPLYGFLLYFSDQYDTPLRAILGKTQGRDVSTQAKRVGMLAALHTLGTGELELPMQFMIEKGRVAKGSVRSHLLALKAAGMVDYEVEKNTDLTRYEFSDEGKNDSSVRHGTQLREQIIKVLSTSHHPLSLDEILAGCEPGDNGNVLDDEVRVRDLTRSILQGMAKKNMVIRHAVKTADGIIPVTISDHQYNLADTFLDGLQRFMGYDKWFSREYALFGQAVLSDKTSADFIKRAVDRHMRGSGNIRTGKGSAEQIVKNVLDNGVPPTTSDVLDELVGRPVGRGLTRTSIRNVLEESPKYKTKSGFNRYIVG